MSIRRHVLISQAATESVGSLHHDILNPVIKGVIS